MRHCFSERVLTRSATEAHDKPVVTLSPYIVNKIKLKLHRYIHLITAVKNYFTLYLPGLAPDSSYTALASLASSAGNHFPELHVSLISLQRSFTEDALRPNIAPIVAQSLPCFTRSL